MVCVTVEIRDKAINYRVRVTAPSIERALEIARHGQPFREVRVVFPISSEDFFAGDDALAGIEPVAESLEKAA